MPKAQRQSRIYVEKYKMGHRSYELIVDREGSSYFGRWTCDNGQMGNASGAESSISDATRGAMLNAQRYHSLNVEPYEPKP